MVGEKTSKNGWHLMAEKGASTGFRKLTEVIEIFSILIRYWVIQVDIFVKTSQIIQ